MTAVQLGNLKAPWKKGERGAAVGCGRKKNRVKDILKLIVSPERLKNSEALSVEEINTIEQVMLSLETADLKALEREKATPVYAKSLARAIITDMQNGRTATVDKLRDRQYGTVKQNVDVTTNGQTLSTQKDLSISEARELVKKLEADY